MAHIALIGASGNAGSRILKELSDRGHRVTGIARNPGKIASLPGVTAVAGDVFDPHGLAALLRGHDAVVSAVHFLASDPQLLLEAVRASGVRRYLVVGGAGSLEVAPGRRLIDAPDFPEAYKDEASKGAAFLELLKTVDDLDWTFLSPSALFVPGERTGIFRLGQDRLLTNEAGSRISFEDYAVALVDEIEQPAHVRQRFTVGY
ncbi:MAG: NAD(P)-dependent oxidoreductase [Solidesulfovibrio sp. DCME]|uniref:NAD(P)-dependent oxidoreductase n=1 Tax=Solidesulfovibrio sp. DCME TaxID=3447380 RepID=UPI003D0D3C99